MGDKAIALTVDNFDSTVLESNDIILVDFWAPWCGPCRMVGPIIEELAGDYEGKIKVGKVNVDEDGELAARYGVMSIPTIILFKNGNIVDKVVGARDKAEFEKMINGVL